jgi:voltage-gated potassium channel
MEAKVQKRALRRIIEASTALIVLLAIGTAGYRLLEDMPLVDALYMTVITVSTVGFGEVRELTPLGRLFTVALIFGGGGVAAYTLSDAAGFFLSGEWRRYIERRRMRQMREELHNHTIVCGYGRMGKHVVDELKAQQIPFVIIEPDAAVVEAIRETGDLVIVGDASNEADLHEAGIEQAHSLIAAASSDADNVFIVLTARSVRPDLLIIARSNDDKSEEKLMRAGASRVILPYRISGRRMVSLLFRPDVADFLDEVMHASKLELLVDQVRLSAGSPLVGQTIAQAHLGSSLGVTVLAYRGPDQKINTSPSAETLLEEGAQLIVLATGVQLQELIRLTNGQTANSSEAW